MLNYIFNDSLLKILYCESCKKATRHDTYKCFKDPHNCEIKIVCNKCKQIHISVTHKRVLVNED